MNLVTQVGEARSRVRTKAKPQPKALPLDTIIRGDCIAEMARLPG